MLFVTLILFNEVSYCQSVKTELGGFELLSDFELNKLLFTQDVLDWNDSEGDYGFTYHSDERNYLAFDLQQFREKNKSNYTYVTDKSLNIKIVKVTDYVYDKKWDDPSKKVTLVVEYFLFDGNSFRRYDYERQQIDDPMNNSLREKVEQFFFKATQNLVKIK